MIEKRKSSCVRAAPAVTAVTWPLLQRAPPRPLLCSPGCSVRGVQQNLTASGTSRRVLAQLELEGGHLHGLQADGGVVGQRWAGVHQSQGHGLQELHVHVLEQSRHTELETKESGKNKNPKHTTGKPQMWSVCECVS